jgi:Mg2+ and Co2+ transporter CorA
MARREISILGFSFLDAMTCGFGAVVLLFMIINASVDLRATQLTSDLRAEADRLEEEVLEGHENLVELRNSLREIEDENVLAQGLSRRMLQTIEELREELATYDQLTLARREHINQLMTDLKNLEESTKRLSGGVPSHAGLDHRQHHPPAQPPRPAQDPLQEVATGGLHHRLGDHPDPA